MKEKLLPILEKIKEYDKIFLFRHFRPDGDAVGSTKGLAAILRETYPEKTVILQNSDFADYLEFLGPEDALVTDEEYKDALGIVIDTATTKRISNQKYSLCREVIKIDHHIPVESYGVLEWVEALWLAGDECCLFPVVCHQLSVVCCLLSVVFHLSAVVCRLRPLRW